MKILIFYLIFIQCNIGMMENDDEELPILNTSIDDTLQKFRQDYFNIESTAMKISDKLFFSVIIKYNQTMFEFYKPFEDMRHTWQNKCHKFLLKDLNPSTERHLRKVCDDVQYFLNRITKIVFGSYKEIYTGGLGTNTIIELQIEDFFIELKTKLNLVVPVYHINSTCVKPLLETFLNIIKKQFHDKVKDLFSGIIPALPKLLRKVGRVNIECARIIRQISDKFESCENFSNKTYCINPVLSELTKCAPKGINRHNNKSVLCGRLYDTISAVYKTFDRHKNLNYYYPRRMNMIYTIIKDINLSIIQWENELENCLL